MPVVETIARIRREHFIEGKTIKEIDRDLGCRGTLSARCCGRARRRLSMSGFVDLVCAERRLVLRKAGGSAANLLRPRPKPNCLRNHNVPK
jgi:hypothetical protein